MSKPNIMDEVQVLRFFEIGPIEKVEVVFKIVSDKMRERLRGRSSANVDQSAEKPGTGKKRPAQQQPSLDQSGHAESST
jgi:hypothetical protein